MATSSAAGRSLAGAAAAAACVGWLLLAAPALAAGQLAVGSHPAGASVWLDGRAVGATPLLLEVAPGDHEVHVRLPGHEARTFRARIVDGLTTKRSVRLGPAAAAPGELRVTTRPAGAALALDGRALGASPIHVHGLRAGRHRLSATWPDGRTATRTVVVHAGLTSSAALGAPPLPKPAAPARAPEAAPPRVAAPPAPRRPQAPAPAAKPAPVVADSPARPPAPIVAPAPAAPPAPVALPDPNPEPAPARWPLPSGRELIFLVLMAGLLAMVARHLTRRRGAAAAAALAWHPARPPRGVQAWPGEGPPDPASASAVADLGSGRFQDAADALWAAVAAGPGSAWHYYHMGLALHLAGRLAEAESAYRTAVQVAPDWEAPRFNLAVALEAMGQRPQAVIAYRQLLEAHPAHVDALFNLGHLYHGLRMHHPALAHWQAARKLAPNDAAVRQNLKLLTRIARTAAARRAPVAGVTARRAG